MIAQPCNILRCSPNATMMCPHTDLMASTLSRTTRVVARSNITLPFYLKGLSAGSMPRDRALSVKIRASILLLRNHRDLK